MRKFTIVEKAESDEIYAGCIENQLNSHQNPDCITFDQNYTDSDGKQDYADDDKVN